MHVAARVAARASAGRRGRRPQLLPRRWRVGGAAGGAGSFFSYRQGYRACNLARILRAGRQRPPRGGEPSLTRPRRRGVMTFDRGNSFYDPLTPSRRAPRPLAAAAPAEEPLLGVVERVAREPILRRTFCADAVARRTPTACVASAPSRPWWSRAPAALEGDAHRRAVLPLLHIVSRPPRSERVSTLQRGAVRHFRLVLAQPPRALEERCCCCSAAARGDAGAPSAVVAAAHLLGVAGEALRAISELALRAEVVPRATPTTARARRPA